MRQNLWLTLMLISFSLSYKALADEVAQKTDGSFVGSDGSFTGENFQNQTDSQFVGENTVVPQNSYFAGDSYQQQVASSTVPAFAQDNSQTVQDYGK